MSNKGLTCKVHYEGTFNDGTKFDSSYDRNEPIEFVCGVGMMIKGFDKAVEDMEVGQVNNVHLTPDEAYGMPDINKIFTASFEDLPGSENLEVGNQVYLSDEYNNPVLASVIGKTDKTITFDANHEMAGKELNFKIELIEVI